MKVTTKLTESLTEVYEWDPNNPHREGPLISIGGGDYTVLGPEQLRKLKLAARVANLDWNQLAHTPKVALDVIQKVQARTGKKL
jgi:hypothetical protein